MKKLKSLLRKLLNDVKQADFKDPLVLLASTCFISFPLLIGLTVYKLTKTQTDIRANSVMIVNRAMNSGGTGIILESTPSKSTILTNDHVCEVVKRGGIVRSILGDSQVVSIVESQVSDLCFITVNDDLQVNTKISNKSPKFYTPAIISGHPALMPNVLSTGHFSGKMIIEVMTGVKPCTKEQMKKDFLCALFGVQPIIKAFESQLVTATIMPGSSGSGVYNEKQQLSGVVFAGSNGFGYAWAVPYEQVLNFIYSEHKHLKSQLVPQELFTQDVEEEKSQMLLAIYEKCNEIGNKTKEDVIKHVCNAVTRDVLWRK